MYEALQVGIGLAVGYVLVSVCESFYHRTLGHASPEFRRICRKLGYVGWLVRRAWFSHTVIHHNSTFKSHYLKQFATAEDEAALRRKLIDMGRAYVIAQSYGLKVGPLIDYVLYVLPTLPVMLVAFYFGGPWFTLGAIWPLIAMPLMSEFVHPMMHLSHEDAVEQVPAVLRPFIRSRYFRFAARHHWVHHRHPEVNFNTILGGDWLLGTRRVPSLEELDEMKALGLCVEGNPAAGAAVS